jgi:hypothetical protein
VQNYNPNPDNDSATPPPEPKAANLITIKDVEVIKPQPGNAAGITFTAVSDNGVVIPVINGSALKLNYAPEMAGVANVTVTAHQGADTVTDTFSVTVLPNLIAKVTANSFQRIIVPGDQGTATAVIDNSGAGQFNGQIDVKFYLSKRTSGDQFGANLDEDDVLVGQALAKNISIPNGGSASVQGSIAIPAELVSGIDAYVIIAQVQKTSGPAELFTDDNVGFGKKVHALTNQFGKATVNFGSSQNPDIVTRDGVKLVFQEADGDLVTLGLTGAGTGQVKLNGDLVNIIVQDTTSTSALTAGVTGIEGRAVINGVEIPKTIGAVNFAKVDLNGFFTATKGVQTLNLGDVSGDQVFTLGKLPGSAAAGTTLNLGSVHDLSIDSNQPIAALNAQEWLDTRGVTDRIITPGLTSLNITGRADGAIRGDFEADVIVEGGGILSSIRVAGLLNDSLITTAGNVGSVKLGGMTSSSLLVGMKDDIRPDAKSDFNTPRRSITSFVITDALNDVVDLFANSQVAAFTIGKIVVRGVDTDGSSAPFGFVADTISDYRRADGPSAVDLTAPAVFDAVGNYSVTVL